MLPRVLEPELMDTDEDAHQYDTMDHSIVNAQFVTDLLTALTDWSLPWAEPGRSQRPVLQVLDLGAGTAQIPIELARRAPYVHITAIDAAESMIALARKNVAAAGLIDHIELALMDAMNLSCKSATYHAVISNSIVHHIPEPRDVLAEAIRVTVPGGLLFHRDLARPNDEVTLQQLVATYAAEATPYQRRLFADSLRAALTADEVADLVRSCGFAIDTVCMTSDRHWTWVATK